MSDLGNDVGQATLNLASKSMEAGMNLIKFLLQKLAPDYNDKMAKQQFEKMRKQEKISKMKGYVSLKKLQESGYDLTYAKADMTKRQLDSFLDYAYLRGVPVSYIANGKDENGVKTYCAVFRTMDKNRIEDITEQLVRNVKIEGIEKIMDDNMHYRKKDFESAIRSVDGKIIDKDNPVIICERTNPNNFIKVSGSQEKYDDGRPYIASLYEVYNDGKKQSSKEFKHGQFLHNCDGEGRNSSSAGEQHWENMKSEMQEKGGFSDDLLVFKDEEDYKQYLEDYSNNREQAEKESEYYDELQAEKDKVIKDDVDLFNEKQTQSLFAEISGSAKEQALSFADTVDHFQVGDWEKEEPYYICKRTDPDNYIEVEAEQMVDPDGHIYNAHSYNVFVDDVQVFNPHREDGRFTDERFEGRPSDDWKNTKSAMKEAGSFTDDCVVFVDKEDYMKYRQLYQQEHSQIIDKPISFETNKDGIRTDFGYIQKYLESCKNEIKQFNDIGSYENGVFTLNTTDMNTLDTKLFNENKARINEASVISSQINNYQSMINKANELVAEKSKLEALEKSDLKNNPLFEGMLKEQAEKVDEKINQMKELQVEEEKLWEQREKITGVKSEIQLRREDVVNTDKKRFTSEELKEFATNFKENKIANKGNVLATDKIKTSDKER